MSTIATGKPNVFSTWIKRYNPADNKYQYHNAAFVELDPNKISDYIAMEDLELLWGTNFARKISQHAFNEQNKSNHNRYFILTDQGDSFENIDSGKILGIAEVSSQGDNVERIEYLQTNPKYIKRGPSLFDKLLGLFGAKREKPPKEFSDIGSAIVDMIEVVSDKTIELFSVKDAIPFYEKKGFICPNPKEKPNYYIREKGSKNNLRLQA